MWKVPRCIRRGVHTACVTIHRRSRKKTVSRLHGSAYAMWHSSVPSTSHGVQLTMGGTAECSARKTVGLEYPAKLASCAQDVMLKRHATHELRKGPPPPERKPVPKHRCTSSIGTFFNDNPFHATWTWVSRPLLPWGGGGGGWHSASTSAPPLGGGGKCF